MMRRERGRVIGRRRTEVGPEAEDAHPHRNNEDRDRRPVSLQAAGRADATQGAHEEAQVEPADVDAQPFQDSRVPPQMRAAHPTGVVEMRVRAFQSLTPAPLQGTPTRASNPSAVGVHRVARRRLRRPAAPAAVRLGNVGAEVEGRQVDEHPIAVVPLSATTSSMTAVSPSVTAATASRSSAAAVTVSAIVVVSP